jgi:hypothetical protein
LSHTLCRAFCELSGLEHSDAQIRAVIPTVTEYYFFPSPRVRDIVDAAVKAKKWVSRSKGKPQPGWPVAFTWSQSRTPNHVGLVLGTEGDYIKTVEYNTSVTREGSQRDGGVIARRLRNDDRSILGYVKLC